MKHVPPECIQWDWVRKGLRQIQRRCGETNWQVGDIFARLDDGRCHLFACDAGFMVLELDHEAVSNRKFLNVWLAWFRPNYAKQHRAELIAWLDRMRDESSSEWWQFSSPREGWIGIEPDCEKHLTIWRRKAK